MVVDSILRASFLFCHFCHKFQLVFFVILVLIYVFSKAQSFFCSLALVFHNKKCGNLIQQRSLFCVICLLKNKWVWLLVKTWQLIHFMNNICFNRSKLTYFQTTYKIKFRVCLQSYWCVFYQVLICSLYFVVVDWDSQETQCHLRADNSFLISRCK